jgi:alkylhydroperoxidase family enzyme
MSESIPRFSFEQLPDEIAEALRPKFERLGYLGEFFAACAHQPTALKAFIDFTEAAKGELEMRIVELIALTVATMKDVSYEKNQHERLSVKLGFGRDWVAAVETLQPTNQDGWSDLERAVQRFVIHAAIHDGHGSADLLDDVVRHVGYDQAIAVLMVMGRYTSHAIMVNSLNIAAPVPSIFDDGFGA